MKTQIKIEHVNAAPKGEGKLIQSSGVRDETAAREWGEREGVTLVYFAARKQRAWSFKPNGAKQPALEVEPGIRPAAAIDELAAPDPDYPADVEAILPEDAPLQVPVDRDPLPAPIAPVRVVVALDHILPNAQQPRGDEDSGAVVVVARSIAEVGLMQVPAAREIEGRPGYYELVFGHTRLGAFQALAAGKIPGADPERFQTMPLDVSARNDLSMFVEAVHENVDRDDLTVIDLAKVAKRAIEVYGMTSAEAGLLINKDASTVRNLIRFLDLPASAQEKLARGEITQNDARALLSMQKVATPKVVADVIKDIQKNAGEKHPDEVIDRALAQLDHKKALVQMWDDVRGGEPRGIRWSSWAWQLNMIKFPVDRLPEITQETLAAAIGAGKVDDVIRLVHRTEGEEEFYIALDAVKISDEDKSKVRNLVRPPACTACPFYTKMRGSHYCGFKICHDRKVEAWTSETIARAGERLKIGVYARSDGPFVLLDNYNRPLFEKRDASLRVIPSGLVSGEKFFHNFPGIDHDIFCVVVVGDQIKSLAKAPANNPGSSGGKLTDAEKIKRRKNLIFRRAYRAIIWEFTAAGAHLFESLNLAALKKIAGWHFIGVDSFPPDDAREGKEDDAFYWRRLIIWQLVDGIQTIGYMSIDSFKMKTPAGELVMVLERLATECGFKVPKAVVNMAADVDAEIAAVKLAPPAAAKKPAARKITPAPKPTQKGSKK